MKKRCKRMFVILMAVVMSLSSSVFAATDDGTFTANSGRAFYTPINATVTLSSTSIRFSNLHWEDRAWGALLYWEGEIRPGSASYEIGDAYSGVSAVTGTLPYLYEEYDEDDLTMGCNDMSGLRASNTYYATATVTAGPSYSSGVPLIFESEQGVWMIVDGLPSRYQAFATQLNTATKRTTSW